MLVVLGLAGVPLAAGALTSSSLGGPSRRPEPPLGDSPQATCDIVAIAAGYNHSLLLRSDGTVQAWGRNDLGQVGDGTTTDRRDPTTVVFPPINPDTTPLRIIAIAAGNQHSLAISNAGQLWVWGANDQGQLGIGTTDYSPHPIPVRNPAIEGIVAVAADYNHSLAIRLVGVQRQVWAWGVNLWGEVGDGTSLPRLSPVPILLNELDSAARIAVGQLFSLAVRESDRSAWAWGVNSQDQLGNGTADANPHPTPTPIPLVTNALDIDGGWHHGIALVDDNPRDRVLCWGQNTNGQLGAVPDSCNSDSAAPAPVNLGTDEPVAVDAGYKHSLAVVLGGQVRSWGFNSSGQLGNGVVGGNDCLSTPDSDSGPQIVHELPGGQPLQGVADVGGGQNHSLALAVDGTVYSWGHNGEGQLGRPTTGPDPFAQRVPGVGPQSPEPLAGDQGNILRGVKSASLQDLHLTWADPGPPVSHGFWRIFRDVDKTALGTTAFGPSVLTMRSFIDGGVVTDYTVRLYFYQLRGLSPCTHQVGP